MTAVTTEAPPRADLVCWVGMTPINAAAPARTVVEAKTVLRDHIESTYGLGRCCPPGTKLLVATTLGVVLWDVIV